METEIFEQQLDAAAESPSGAMNETAPEALHEKDEAEINALKAELLSRAEELSRLNEKLCGARLRLSLLLFGAAKERLDEAAALAGGLCAAGKNPEEAASEVVSEYPHLRAVQREIPQFSAASAGSADGFSSIRRIFAGK